MKKCILIYSGGMDSTTLLYDLVNKQYKPICLTFNYGSKHNFKEIECSKYNTNKLKLKHYIINLYFINKYFKSNLLKSGNKIPHGHYTNKNQKKTVVPFRNGIMISIAVGLAESLKIKEVFIASHSGDYAIYPDCRPAFNQFINDLAYIGTYIGVNVCFPYQNISKKEIALIGKKLKINYNYTWSCYKGEDKQIGRAHV
jgi:7-cyano-7-deazaguanine synthase